MQTAFPTFDWCENDVCMCVCVRSWWQVNSTITDSFEQTKSRRGGRTPLLFLILRCNQKLLDGALIVRSSQIDTVSVSTVINRIPNGSVEEQHSESKNAFEERLEAFLISKLQTTETSSRFFSQADATIIPLRKEFKRKACLTFPLKIYWLAVWWYILLDHYLNFYYIHIEQ